MTPDHTGAVTDTGRRAGGLLAAMLAAVIAFQLNATMLNPAVADMQHRLHATAAQVGLQATVFFLSAALFGIFLPRLSDIVGRRPMLIGVLTATNLGSVLALLAPGIELLYVARAIQGVSGVLVPLALIMLREQVDPARFGTYMGIVTGVNGGVSGIDAIAGGLIVDAVGFRGVFAVTLVVGVIATAMSLRLVGDAHPSAGARMDWPGTILLCAAVGTLTVAITNANSAGWTAPITVGLLVVSVVLFGVFHTVERRVAEPLVPVALMTDRATWGLLLTTILTLAGVFAAINFITPAFAENPDAGFGMSASVTSLLYLMPYALIGWLIAPLSGRLAPRLGWRLLLRIGIAGSIATLLLMRLGLASPGVLVACAVLLGITYAGIGNIMLAGLGVVLSPPRNPGLLPGVNSAAFNIGASLGIALLAPLVSAGSPAGSDSTAGYEHALLVAMVIAVLALGASFLIPGRQRDGERV